MKWRCPSKECLNICSLHWTCLGLSPGSCHNASRLAVSSSPGGAAQCWPRWASSWPGCPHWHGREQPSSSVIFVTLRIIWIKNSRYSRFTNSLFFSNESSVAAIFSLLLFVRSQLTNHFKCSILPSIFTWYFSCKPEP